MSRSQQNYYTNPAFSQQSEYYHAQQQRKALSPPRRQNSFRQPPVGAQTTHVVNDTSLQEIPPRPGPKPKKYIQEDDCGEQEFYEEIIVDDSGFVKDKKVVVVHSQQNNCSPTKYSQPALENRLKPIKYVETSISRYEDPTANINNICNRYEEIPERYQDISKADYINPNKPHLNLKHRYEYIPMQDQEVSTQRSNNNYHNKSESTEFAPRYTIIQSEDETELIGNNNRYALLPTDNVTNSSRYQQPQTYNRYEYLSDNQNHRYQVMLSPQAIRKNANPVATQKLHELLTTPKKSTQKSPPSSTPIKQDPFRTPQKPTRVQTPKSQQKLNYTLASRQISHDKRHTAIIAPICSSPVQSVYSETTYSNKTESWMNLSINKPPVQATLAVAAVMMILCGGVTSALCFYMVSIMGRLYYLDFGIVSGFACLLLGLLGFRSRNCYWLPNRNYISGYIVLSVFSLLTCAGLLVLLFMQPKPGTPLADMTSGGVCGISVLSLILASTGVIASYCCKYPPPDNRVQHCARGFIV